MTVSASPPCTMYSSTSGGVDEGEDMEIPIRSLETYAYLETRPGGCVEVSPGHVTIHPSLHRHAAAKEFAIRAHTPETKPELVTGVAGFVLDTLLSGHAVTVVAMGPPGTGKSSLLWLPEGILDVVLAGLYAHCEGEGAEGLLTVGVSCFELGDQSIYDLLTPERSEVPPSAPAVMCVHGPDEMTARQLVQYSHSLSDNWTDDR
eukprot:g13155.t1